jgi:hypothetical protein
VFRFPQTQSVCVGELPAGSVGRKTEISVVFTDAQRRRIRLEISYNQVFEINLESAEVNHEKVINLRE